MPIIYTQSGKKYLLNKVYILNKQIFKNMAVALFSCKISILLLVLTGYRFVLSCRGGGTG